VDIVAVDVSFISVEKVVPTVVDHVKRNGQLLILIKPQFEAGRSQVGKGGVIRDPKVHASVLGRFVNWAINQGLRLRGLKPSHPMGQAGNQEFFCRLEKAYQT
jgi:23S rRNA (cytidine1920-2'-O)/16S rRNA (cytidine1409-2'-O)-methyltransferase